MKARTTTVGALALLLAYNSAPAVDDVAAMKKLEAKDWMVPSVKMEMRLIPAGSFTRGSPKDEISRRDDEVQHKVTISKPFYIAGYECRQREFYKLMMPKDYDYDAWQWPRGPLHDGAAWTHRRHVGRNGERYPQPDLDLADARVVEAAPFPFRRHLPHPSKMAELKPGGIALFFARLRHYSDALRTRPGIPTRN